MPACCRARSNSSSKTNSSACESYSARTAELFSIFFTSWSCVFICLDLSLTCTGNFHFVGRRLGRLLHESMEHHDPPNGQNTKEYSSNPFLGFQAQLEQALAQGACVRHPQIWPEDQHAFREVNITSLQASRKTQNRFLKLLAAVNDFPFHYDILTCPLAPRLPRVAWRGSASAVFFFLIDHDEGVQENSADRIGRLWQDERRLVRSAGNADR
jgi:hypothetical protein